MHVYSCSIFRRMKINYTRRGDFFKAIKRFLLSWSSENTLSELVYNERDPNEKDPFFKQYYHISDNLKKKNLNKVTKVSRNFLTDLALRFFTSWLLVNGISRFRRRTIAKDSLKFLFNGSPICYNVYTAWQWLHTLRFLAVQYTCYKSFATLKVLNTLTTSIQRMITFQIVD